MQKYNITGMSCAACSARVEKAVKNVSGVTSCAVNLLTNSMGVEGTAKPESIISAVEKAGYGASIVGEKQSPKVSPTNNAEKSIVKRLVWSVIFLIPLMYISMGHMMWGFPMPSFFDGNHVAMGLAQLILSGIIMVINQKFFISGFRGLINKAPNMDTLVAMGSMASFVWSVFVLFAMTKAQADGNSQLVEKYMMDFYFESAGTILTLITVGKMLESHSKGKTTDAIKSLMELAPKTAVVVRDGMEIEIPAEELKKGDIFCVRAGQSIPADGVVTEGSASVNESSLTGESVPAEKEVGDNVSASTVNMSGYIRCEAVNIGEDTALSKIIKMVEDASATKAPIAKIADRVSGVFVPTVIIIAILTVTIWLAVGQTVGYALARGISVLVISCPCALGLATPVAIMVGSGVGAKNGILFKTAESLEETGKIQAVALDKTGTVTEGKPVVTDVIPATDFTEEKLLEYAFSLESKSEHLFAKAVNDFSLQKNISAKEICDFRTLAGNGLEGVLDGKKICGGSVKYISGVANIPENILEKSENLAEQGKTPLMFAIENKLIGMIAVADVIKKDSAKAINELKNMGIRVVMLTGDNEKTANAIGKQAGVDEVIAGVLPDGKESVIRELKKQYKTAMAGDGINDAPALASADIGIAVGNGTDIAIDTADVVLMKSSLRDIPASIRLSRAVLRNIRQNLFWAFIYNSIGIPLAMGAFIKLFGWTLNPMFGALAMSLSSFCVVTNSLRLNLVNVYNPSRDKVKNNTKKENAVMTKELTIEGMMCQHCEKRVKDALEALPHVTSAEVSHEKGNAVVVTDKEIRDSKLTDAVEKAGYKVTALK